jgi:hypothetical protein
VKRLLCSAFLFLAASWTIETSAQAPTSAEAQQAATARASGTYTLGPDSLPQEGRLEGPTLFKSHGHWFLANQQMLAALNFANRTADAQKIPGPRYEVKHEWGDGSHSDNHGGAILPDILRWLWSDQKLL